MKAPGVAFVAVADDELPGARLDAGHLPLAARGEAAAAAAPQARVQDLAADRLGLHLPVGPGRGLVAALGEVLPHVLGVQAAAVLEHGALLQGVEGDLVPAPAGLAGGGVGVEQAGHGLAVQEGLPDDLAHIRRAHLAVEDAVGLHAEQRPHLAEALAAALGEQAVPALRSLEVQLDVQLEAQVPASSCRAAKTFMAPLAMQPVPAQITILRW